MMTPGYEALTTGAALLDLSARGRIRVTGEDRARLLHAMTTNHIQQMKPGDGLYAFFLNAQGRILADAVIYCFEDHFLIDTEASTREAIYQHLDHYIIADDVTLEDVTEQTFCLSLEGPKAAEVAARAGITAPHHRFSHAPWGEFVVASCAATGPRGIRIFGAAARTDEANLQLENAGAVAATAADAELVRLENFVPRYGCDITQQNIPQETQQIHALHFQKGCYLGQEIVERVRSRGHVNKLLMGFRLEAGAAPAPGAKLLVEGQPSGEVTSAALVNGVVFGMAYVRVPGARSGATAAIDGHAVELFAPAS
jgi:folate-binding protein YgfZ